MEKISACPCGNDVLVIQESFLDSSCEIRCQHCGRTSGEVESRDAAVRAWNARTKEELD
jgi:hypothetical protein